MRKRALQKLKQNSAFTLMELLVVVAIIGILAGFSLIGISNIAKSMKMTELDSYAKNVYLEAQNQLASLEVEGSLTKLRLDLSVEGGAYYDEFNSRKLTQAPTDYDVDLFGSFYQRMYFFTDRDSIITTFIPEESFAGENGRYLVELNPETGDVYGVFYWEEDNENFQGSAKSIYEAIQKMTVSDGDGHNRALNSRSEYEIGYYGGIVTKTTSPSDYKLDQQVEVINGEELFVKISYDYSGRMLDYDKGDTEFTVKVTVTGTQSGAEWKNEIDVSKNDYVNLETIRLETGILLDGLGEKRDFKSITSGANFIPGENLSIQVKTIFKQGDVHLVARSQCAEEPNSLFETISTVDGTTTIGVSRVRHLRNLGAEYYPHTLPGNVIISQQDDIDFAKSEYAFNENGYYVGEGEAEKPVDAIAPITNNAIFENTTNGRTVTIKGNGFIAKNLSVKADAGTQNAGLFSSLTNVTVEQLSLEDYTLQAAGCSNVGALAGFMSGGSITDSGVYLDPDYVKENGVKTYYNQEADAEYGTVMNRHYQLMSVTGGEDVGGLIGEANGTSLSKCFAAVVVRGNRNVGGLIGNANNQTINNCYASGNVYHVTDADTVIGGFLGQANGLTVTDAYATGNIYGANMIAGFVGSSVNGVYTNCSSYGEVLMKDGTDDFTGKVAGGMIASSHGDSDGNGTCHYLTQLDYNSTDAFVDAGLAYSYSDFTKTIGAGELLKTADTFSYDAQLLYKAFPFKPVTDTYYGDWPLQYLINTALVYYEKYEDGSYGYYSVTSLTDTSENGEAGTDGTQNVAKSDYVWVLDSLQDRTCVEDGYALLTMYYLDSFEYVSYQFKGGSDETNSTWQQNNAGKLTIVDDYPRNENGEIIGDVNDYSVALRRQGFITFNAYNTTEGVDEYTVDYSNMKPEDTFITSGMYLYQLPYELQCTDRYNVYNFYDRFVIFNAFAKGNTSESAESVIGGKQVEDAETFFYSPHFARTAVNPGLDVESNETLLNPETVFVRSARQLNALGRVPYYWNKIGGASNMTFLQEVDIDFGRYTDGTKLYCGTPYDLMDTSESNTVRNRPIGMPDLVGSYCQFRNIYDGNYHHIIDYRQSTNEQFAGLFGEIQNATIKNVFMTVSKPGEGYIRSSHQPTTGNSTRRAGVGALIGLAYMEGNTIENCSASGYTVEYVINETRSGCVQPRGIAVGGLFGMCMSSANNCTTTNDVLLTVNYDYADSNKAVFLGGLAGSYYYGTLSNVYAGGTIDINMSGDYTIYRMRIGGLCPGFMYTARSNEEVDSVTYRNFYTYTDISKDIWNDLNDNLDNDGSFDHLIPSVSRMSWNKDNTGNTRCLREVDVPAGYGAFYLQEMLEYHVNKINEFESDVTEYFTRHFCTRYLKTLGKTDDPITYDDLANVEGIKSKFGINNDDMSNRATESYPYDSERLDGKEYPFPAFNYKMVDGEKVYIHFGDWPLKEDLVQ